MALQKMYIKSEQGKKTMSGADADSMARRLVSGHDEDSGSVDVMDLRSRLRSSTGDN